MYRHQEGMLLKSSLNISYSGSWPFIQIENLQTVKNEKYA